MKIAIIDVETTGLDPVKDEIIEIGAVIFDDEKAGSLETVNVKIKPEHIETALKEALVVNGYKKEDWADAVTMEQAMQILSPKVDGAIFCAYNMLFDWRFIEEACKKLFIMLPFSYRKLDLLTMAWCKLDHKKMRNWKLKTVCKALDIEPEPEEHRAINGAMTEYEVYKKLMK